MSTYLLCNKVFRSTFAHTTVNITPIFLEAVKSIAQKNNWKILSCMCCIWVNYNCHPNAGYITHVSMRAHIYIMFLFFKNSFFQNQCLKPNESDCRLWAVVRRSVYTWFVDHNSKVYIAIQMSVLILISKAFVTERTTWIHIFERWDLQENKTIVFPISDFKMGANKVSESQSVLWLFLF